MVENGCRVELSGPGRVPLLGLLLANLLERAIRRPGLAAKCRRIEGAVRVRAGRMSVYLVFQDGRILVTPSFEGRPRAELQGDLQTLAQVALGSSPVWAYLRGRIRVRGSLFFLLKLLPLVRSYEEAGETGRQAA